MGSAAQDAGLEDGWSIPLDNAADWLNSTGATPQQHREVAARRFMSMTSESRVFTAQNSAGVQKEWEEKAPAETPSVRTIDGGIRILRFGSDTPSLMKQYLQNVPEGEPVIIDLRGNTGGQLVAADSRENSGC